MKQNKKKKTVTTKKVNQPKNLTWIIGGIIFLALAAGVIYFGTKDTEKKLGIVVPKKQAEPTSVAQARPTIPGTEAHPPEDMDLMETPPPKSSPEPTEKTEPTVVPDEDVDYSDKFLIPFSGYQKLVKEDLEDFSDLDLKKARNEIYARYGRKFISQDMACYFAKQSWYKINSDYSEKLLSPVEVSNAVFILNYEKERQSAFVNKDSGCEE